MPGYGNHRKEPRTGAERAATAKQGSRGTRLLRSAACRALRAEAHRARRCRRSAAPLPQTAGTRSNALTDDRASTTDRAVLPAPGILSPRKDTVKGAPKGASPTAIAQAPPLTLIFHGKTPAPIRRTGQYRLSQPAELP